VAVAVAAHLTEELLEQVEQVVVEMVETAHLLQHPQVRQIKVLVEVAGVLLLISMAATAPLASSS
jgi:hypothetical protein